jgi:hypothetical protein
MDGSKSFVHQYNRCYCKVIVWPHFHLVCNPFIIVIDQGTHFINDVIHYLTNHFIQILTNFILLYIIHREINSTNKIFGTLFKKLVNENLG